MLAIHSREAYSYAPSRVPINVFMCKTDIYVKIEVKGECVEVLKKKNIMVK